MYTQFTVQGRFSLDFAHANITSISSCSFCVQGTTECLPGLTEDAQHLEACNIKNNKTRGNKDEGSIERLIVKLYKQLIVQLNKNKSERKMLCSEIKEKRMFIGRK